MPSRKEVFDAIDSERAYQDSKWNSSTTETGGKHSVEEFVLYMQDYLTECIHILSREASPAAKEKALHWVRKITTLGVSCMEQNGAPRREGF